MHLLRDYLSQHALAVVLLLVALLSAGALLIGRARVFPEHKSWLWWVVALGCFALGGLALSAKIGMLVALSAAGWLFLMFLITLVSGLWWAPLGFFAAFVLLLGLGGWSLPSANVGIVTAYRFVRSIQAAYPWWLLLFTLIPVLVWLSFRSLAGLGPFRRLCALALRATLLGLLILALAEVQATHRSETTSVIFVVDGSYSIAEQEHALNEAFVNLMAEKRAATHFQVGVVYFGAQPRVVRSPTDIPKINVKYRDALGNIDRHTTNLANALKLAMASFPEGTSKRIVLLTDGNENVGSVEEQARLAKLNGVQIDVVPIGAGQRRENEVLIQSIDTQAEVDDSTPLLIQIAIRSFNPNLVEGTLNLKQRLDSGELVAVLGVKGKTVRLKPGINTFTFEQPRSDRAREKQNVFTYVADFTPHRVLSGDGKEELSRDFSKDLKQNNSATAHVIARREKTSLLLLEPIGGELKLLADSLPKEKYKITRMPIAKLAQDDLAASLSAFDSVVLANIPATSLTEEQQEVLKSNTRDQGCGLIMVGGPEGFGAGGWQDTPLEKALPVDTNIKSFKVQDKVGLVLIMHASEMPKGNDWEKQIAKVAIKELGDRDEVGVIYFNWASANWHIKLTPVGDASNKQFLMKKVDQLSPGDTGDFDPALRLAIEALTDPAKELARKHVIVISDGDPLQNDGSLITKMQQNRISMTTIGIATHDAANDGRLQKMATSCGGRYYKVQNPSKLPDIYLKETRLISQDYVYRKEFTPGVVPTGPADGLRNPLPPLRGFVRTTLKPSDTVIAPIMSPTINGHDFPILAYWHYGLGKVIAYTSDADTFVENAGGAPKLRWSSHWHERGLYGKFWEQMIDWSLRPVESKRLNMTTETRDGKTRVIVTARDEKDRPLNNLSLRGGVTPPGAGKGEERPKIQLKFEQKAAGTYEAEFKADEAGSYIINAQLVKKQKETVKDPAGKEKTIEREIALDHVRGAVSLPYSPEFAEVESNVALLKKVMEMTEGQEIPESRLYSLWRAGLSARKLKPLEGSDEEKEFDVTVLPSEKAVKAFNEEASSLTKEVFRPGLAVVSARQPLWFWLLFAAGVLLLFDVAIRRITVDPDQVTALWLTWWGRLRRQPSAASTNEGGFMDRLKTRKERVEDSLVKARAKKRFEVDDKAPTKAPPPVGADEAPPPPKPSSTGPTKKPTLAPQKEPEGGGGGLDRLAKAKRKVREELDKKSDREQG